MEHISNIHNKALNFPNLFILRESFSEPKIFESLSLRNKIALEFVENILSDKSSIYLDDKISNDKTEVFKDTLKWILETGAVENGLSNDYDKVLDMASIIITKEYKDETILPIIADMIFYRHKKGLLIHDLVWGFFESRKLSTLNLISERLISEDKSEFKLACKLLNLEIENEKLPRVDKNWLYKNFICWIEENKRFIYFTGESFQQKSNPAIFNINHEAKYLCKSVSIDRGIILSDLHFQEKQLLSRFKVLNENSKLLLENYSLNLYKKNRFYWEDWINCPISLQIEISLWRGQHD